MQSEKHHVHLSEVERKKLLAIISKGRNKAVVIQRAHILLKVDEGKTDGEISDMLYVSEQTIRRTRLRFATESVEAALEDKPHPPKEVKLKEKEEAYLIALACRRAGRWRCLPNSCWKMKSLPGFLQRRCVYCSKKQPKTLAGTKLVHSRDHTSVSPADGSDFEIVSATLQSQASAGVF
jgi:transposase